MLLAYFDRNTDEWIEYTTNAVKMYGVSTQPNPALRTVHTYPVIAKHIQAQYRIVWSTRKRIGSCGFFSAFFHSSSNPILSRFRKPSKHKPFEKSHLPPSRTASASCTTQYFVVLASALVNMVSASTNAVAKVTHCVGE
jgi:hypothetical protein